MCNNYNSQYGKIKSMRVIYLSAHLDDAILSAGGLIYDQTQKGIPVEIWTFMCGIPEDKPKESYLRRIEEDVKAAKVVGANTVHFMFPDAFNRGYSEVRVPISPEDNLDIATVIKEKLLPDDQLVVPLSVGGHVDHVLLRKEAEKLDQPLTYYMDFPYIDYVPETLNETIIGLIKHPVTISPSGLFHWEDAAKEYASQDLYPTPEITREKIIDYWAHINGIFLWERQTAQQIFTKIYYDNLWNDKYSVSGPGSTLKETEEVRRVIPEIIEKYKIKSILDFPCGDFGWMRLLDLGIDYTGADIVFDMIRTNQKLYGSLNKRRFLLADIIEGYIPTANLFLCRDCLGHFSQNDTIKTIQNIKKSSCEYLLTTTFPEVNEDLNIATGKWRPINLQVAPYNFPNPVELIDEKVFTNYGIKCLGLWKIKDLP